MTMLELNSIEISYGKKDVIKNLTFSIEKGETIGILGKNGAGKTTLFNAIYGLTNFKGEINYDNIPLKPSKVAFVETENFFYPYIKGKEYINFFNSERKNIIQLINAFDIPLDEFIHNFSTGMKKKLAIIANIIMDKPIIVLDEPFNGLDFESVEKLYLLLQKIKNDNRIIFISSHILETLKNCCDKIIHIEKGTIKQIYSKSEFELIEKVIRTEIKDNFSEINNAW